jgi:hypothetical protein
MGDDGHFRYQDRSVLDEYPVGVLGERGEPLHLSAERGECRHVVGVLLLRARQVDHRAREEAELAARQRARDLPDEGPHVRRTP